MLARHLVKPITHSLFLLFGVLATHAMASDKPNIVIMVADDLGWADVGYHGGNIDTPSLDKLAEEGVRLNRFYTTPICSPTRAALMTGRDPHSLGHRLWRDPSLGQYWCEPSRALYAAVISGGGLSNSDGREVALGSCTDDLPSQRARL